MELVCALILTIFSVCFRGIDGNNVTLTPSPIATVTEGDDLKLQCYYSGSFSLITVNWYLNSEPFGLVLRASNCSYLSTPSVYEINRYIGNCSTPSFSLLIRNVTKDKDNNVSWACNTTPSGILSPAKASTIINVIERTAANASLQSLSNSTTTKETVTSTSSPSTSTSSTKVTTTSTLVNPAATGPTANATINTSTPTNYTTTGSTSTTKSNSSQGGDDTKVIVLAVVVPIGGLLLIGVIILVLCIRHRRSGKNDHEIPDAAQKRSNNVDGFKHDRTAKQLNAIQTTSDDLIIYPGPAAMSTARPNKDKKHHIVTDQYQTPYTGTYGYQTAYVPSIYMSDRSSTHKDTNHHNVGHPYSRPYTGTYGYQNAYGPSTYMSARTYPSKNKSYDYEPSYRIADSRPAYDQTAYYPQTGYNGKISQDVYYKGGGHDSYGQRSRPHLDHSGRKQQREYYSQYEMADYGGSRTQYGQTKQYGQNTAFYY